MVRRVMVWQARWVVSGIVAEWYVLFRQAWQVAARCGMIRHGGVSFGMAGMAALGEARLCKARFGMVTQG